MQFYLMKIKTKKSRKKIGFQWKKISKILVMEQTQKIK